MPLMPCRHCGMNFMPENLHPDAKKLCNNCLLRDRKTPTKENFMDSTMQMIINLPREIQIEIEEICLNQGIDFSQYFLNLHKMRKENISNPCIEQSLSDEKLQEFAEKFENSSHTPKKKGKK